MNQKDFLFLINMGEKGGGAFKIVDFSLFFTAKILNPAIVFKKNF
jgi:hypothetical protein